MLWRLSQVVPSVAALIVPLLVATTLAATLGPALEGRGPLGEGGTLTAAEAVLFRDYGFLERYLQAGGSLDARMTVRPGLFRSQEWVLTPLEAAIGGGPDELFDYLWSRGVAIEDGRLTDLICLARRERRLSIAERLQGSTGSVNCDAARYPW